MSSRQTEDVHTILLKKILSDSGLECTRSPVETPLSSLEGEAIEEEPSYEEEEIEVEPPREEEPELTMTVEEEEHRDGLFPTPSLRRMVPERVRRMEAHNRVHVLPDKFTTDIDPQAIPKIKLTAPQRYIDILAEMVGCDQYKSSLAEFWFLDTLANLLRRAQEDGLDRPTQAVLILWWCEWMKEIQNFDAADRARMMRRFEENMVSAARFVAAESHLPTPEQAGVYYKAPEDPSTQEPKGWVLFEGAAYECSLTDLTKILHYIYDIFSTPFQFDLVRSIFCFTPGYELIDAPYQMQNPKKNYQVAKSSKKEKSPKKEKKADKGGAKGKKVEPDNEEYLYLMSVKAREQAELEAQEEIEREQWLRKSRILPLSFAATDELFNKYWPPPPPPEPEPEPQPKQQVPDVKKKGKK